MDALLTGFADELVKLSAAQAETAATNFDPNKAYRDVSRKARKTAPGMDETLDQLRGKGRQVSRDYLASMIIGGIGGPLASMAGKRLSRGLHNREVMKALKGARSQRQKKRLISELQTGPMLGPGVSTKPGKPGDKPTMTYSELAGHSGRGALMGSVFQMLRDRFAGSAGIDNKKS